MKKLLLILTILPFLISCASTATSNYAGSHQQKTNALSAKPASDDLAAVYIVRDDSFFGMGVAFLIGVDTQPIVGLDNHSFTRVDMPPGKYKFKYVINAEDFNKPTSDHRHGSKDYYVKPGVANIVLLESKEFKLAKNIFYGRSELKRLTSGASYQVPNKQVIRNAKMLPTEKTSVKIAAVKTSTFSQTANIAKQKQLSVLFASTKKAEPCKLKNPNWAYTGKSCKNGYADGQGSAEDIKGLKFIGTFAKGHRIKGEIHQAGNMIFSGDLVDDKPNGSAICLHEGEYEECRYYKGKRIDTLYKIRRENTKMRVEMAKNSKPQVMSYSGAKETGITDYASDAMQREASDRASNFIFDQLF